MPTLFEYQKKAVRSLLAGKRICLMGVGTCKTAVMFNWLRATGKKKIVIVTTASKVRSGDMDREAVMWNGKEWVDSLQDFTIISWHKLRRWLKEHYRLPLEDYAIAFNEAVEEAAVKVPPLLKMPG